tara:strand:- start:1450 stop:1722 length:273 start_codon:yes stop_codon:yes gene_type:complete
MDKKLVRAFVQECIDVQDWEARQKANYIEMNEWFKYSGRVEEEKELYEFKSYEPLRYADKLNHMCDTIHDIRKEIKEYENTNKNGNKQRK